MSSYKKQPIDKPKNSANKIILTGLQVRKFQRRVENFMCDNCNVEVIGNGFTNHCPVCLHSKHVDVNPGDRNEECRKIMKPINLFKKSGKVVIEFKCVGCGIIKTNKISEKDNLEILNYSHKSTYTITY